MKSDRTWALPARKHLMRMSWHDLLFAHWPVEASDLNALLPSGVEVDCFRDQAWIGVVPFRMADVAPRGFPALPGLSAFPELNVRTYVTFDGKPGVWFFSLDASNPIAVRAARRFFFLPYMDAEMAIERHADEITYASRRTHRGEAAAQFVATYRPSGPPFFAEPGSLEYWLTARYCLYTRNRRGQILRGEIDHPPWPLQPATAEIEQNTMASGLSLELPGPPHLLFVDQIHVQAWSNERIGRRAEAISG